MQTRLEGLRCRKGKRPSQLLQMNRLVFNQKAKLIELTNQFKIRDEGGQDVGFIQQEGQTTLKKVARFVSSLDQFMTHTLAVYDGAGQRCSS